MILTTPLIERLAREGEVHVVATPANAAVLANHPSVASVIVYDKRNTDAGLTGLRRVAARLRATGASTAYMAQGSWRTAALARLAGVPSVGFDTSAGRWLYSRRVVYRKDWHHAQRLWALASNPGDRSLRAPESMRPSLYPGESDQAQVVALLHAAGVGPSERLIALAPGSVWATKRWPSYDALASELVAGLRAGRVAVLGAASDASLATAIGTAVQQRGGPPILDATGKLSLLGSAALLSRCAVLVTNDSAPLHLASAMNTPTVALFGPTVPAMGFGPLSDRHVVMGRDELTCRPCSAHGGQACPLGHWKCMRDVEPSVVLAQVVRMSGPSQ
ncbi:glycosyltransferase family 9 protein [Gemmatimonas groenlandica]|uniref:Glycosyltransferase family 9 protein n=1 Tax=Gemmatimonas groenlandica TaxID=2732249 RepID=A0A6M4IMH2_9BACT|nr:glycosyltransferase family 9 protein [Gemmatimonas groenlandica]QJR34616.1 glycosyltransferase family 9 protein [Gemmatimonas groenlandica]